MEQGRSSRTARIVAGLRAAHTLHDGGRVFTDSYGAAFLSGKSKRLLTNRLVYRASYPMAATVLLRSRFTEDGLTSWLAQQEERSANQYVILGAGFDTFAVRKASQLPDLQIFELDHPATQAMKKQRWAEAGLAIPENHHFVPVDFEQQSLTSALAASAYSPTVPTYWSWLGVTHYLTHEAVAQSLQSMAGMCEAGAELVLDYSLPAAELPLVERWGIRATHQVTKRWGEPLFGHWNSNELARVLKRTGWQVAEDLGATEQKQRYQADLPQGMIPPAAIHLLRARSLSNQ